MNHVRLFVDSRGLSRPILDFWVPWLDADTLWIVDRDNAPRDDDRPDLPVTRLSPAALVAVIEETAEPDHRVVAVLPGLQELHDAATLGLPPARVIVTWLDAEPEARRIAAGVHLSAQDETTLEELRDLGFEFALQPLPNVTARLLPVADRDP